MLHQPRVRLGEGQVHLGQFLGQRLRPTHLGQDLPALLVVVAFGLQLGHGLAARLRLLGVQDGHRVLQRRLDHAHHVEFVAIQVGVEQFEGRHRERAQRLVEREVVLQARGEVVAPPACGRDGAPDDDASLQQRPAQRHPTAQLLALLPGVSHRRPYDTGQRGTGLLVALQQVEQHRVAHLEAGMQCLGLGGDQPVEAGLGVVDEAFRRLLAPHTPQLLLVIGELGQHPGVLDLVFRGLHHHVADRVETGTPGPARDLMELAGPQQPLPAAVELAQGGEHDRADRYVDAHPERVGAADHAQKTLLGERFDQSPVLRQQPGMMHADAGTQHLHQRRPEPAGESETADRLDDTVSGLRIDQLHAHQALCLLGRRRLAGMHQVDRRRPGVHQLGQRLGQGRHRPLEDQRYRTRRSRQHLGRASGALGEQLDQTGHITQGGAHDHELRLGQLAGRHLPGPAAIGVGDEVVFVGHHHLEVGAGTLAQRDVGQDLGRAADDRRVRVHRGVPGDHADQVGAEVIHPGEELLADQRLDRGGVVDPAAGGQCRHVCGGGDQRFARTGRGGDDRVRAGEGGQQRVRLMGIERHASLLRPSLEGRVQGVRPGPGAQFVQQGGEAGGLGHAADSLMGRPDRPNEQCGRLRRVVAARSSAVRGMSVRT